MSRGRHPSIYHSTTPAQPCFLPAKSRSSPTASFRPRRLAAPQRELQAARVSLLRPLCLSPLVEAMTLAGTICSLLLLSVLWMELAMAGASFRSPEHHSAQVRPQFRPYTGLAQATHPSPCTAAMQLHSGPKGTVG